MVTHTLSSLRVPTLTGALAALLHTGCVAPTNVGTQGDPLAGLTAHAMAFHQAPDEETLHVVISTSTLSCDNPTLGSSGSDGTCPVGWTVTFALPAASQAAGTYSLSDPGFEALAMQSLGSDGNGACVGGGGGGGVLHATIEVVSIGTSTMKVRLSGLDGDADLPQADGEYDVPLCM
jgi:hypothetical protein